MDEVKKGSRQELLTEGLAGTAVDIVGLGMHGSWTALALARMGAGKLRLWDGDAVDIGNLETQFYNQQDIGDPKPLCLETWLRSLGYAGEIETVTEFFGPGEFKPYPVVISCVDSMDTRKQLAAWACKGKARYFVESRSAGHDGFVHAFRPTAENTANYIDNYFPAKVAEVPCGATGSIAMGFQVASLIGSLIALTKGGEDQDLADAIPGEHEVALGLGHIVKTFGR